MSAVLAGIIAIPVFGNSRAMVAGMGAEPAVVPEGTRYLRVMVPGLFFMWILTVLTGAMRGAGDMRTPMKVNIVASILSSLGNNRLSVSKAVASLVWFRTGRWRRIAA